jgi:hypothetical protein
MAVDTCEVVTPTLVWSPAETLSPRVRRLRDQYWSFYTREYTNEVRAYTTGTPWDHVYSPWNWTNVPEMALFLNGARAYLRAAATPVDLPPGFWKEPLVVRRALFFRRVVEAYLPVQILEGELIVGSHFNAALSPHPHPRRGPPVRPNGEALPEGGVPAGPAGGWATAAPSRAT